MSAAHGWHRWPGDGVCAHCGARQHAGAPAYQGAHPDTYCAACVLRRGTVAQTAAEIGTPDPVPTSDTGAFTRFDRAGVAGRLRAAILERRAAQGRHGGAR